MTENKPWADYIGIDLLGHAYNKKYPPREGLKHSGYKTPNQEVFLYDYAVQGYGVVFQYQGVRYLIPEDNLGILTDSTHNIIVGEFEDPIQLLENVKLGGRTLISIIDLLESVDLQ